MAHTMVYILVVSCRNGRYQLLYFSYLNLTIRQKSRYKYEKATSGFADAHWLK